MIENNNNYSGIVFFVGWFKPWIIIIIIIWPVWFRGFSRWFRCFPSQWRWWWLWVKLFIDLICCCWFSIRPTIFIFDWRKFYFVIQCRIFFNKNTWNILILILIIDLKKFFFLIFDFFKNEKKINKTQQLHNWWRWWLSKKNNPETWIVKVVVEEENDKPTVEWNTEAEREREIGKRNQSIK